MKNKKKPHFIIKENLQKSKQTGVFFKDIVTPKIMEDICNKITGCKEFTYKYVDNNYKDDFLQVGYNKGRLAIMLYEETVSYISFSEEQISGRNSSVQSVPTAFNMFFMNELENKNLYYYFLNTQGNAGTDYQMLIYRIMKTMGFNFLNDRDSIGTDIIGFKSVDDIMYSRQVNSERNKSNHSTYITKTDLNQYEIYGKTYGANKYETSIICYAISLLSKPNMRITLYEMLEGNLAELPKSSLDVLKKMGNINIVPTDIQLEKRIFEKSNSLRSKTYIYNLLKKLGHKRCVLCNCEISELIQGAHIWPVSNIKKNSILSIDEKVSHAINGDNGLWLCQNHHKLFDEGLIYIDSTGIVRYKDNIESQYITFMDNTTTIKQIPHEILTDKFIEYISLRNSDEVLSFDT